MGLSMDILHLIPDVLTKLHIQIILILTAILFLSPARFEF
jgi:hypothetical protein